MKEKVREALSRAFGRPVELSVFEPLSGGACQENFRVELAGAAGFEPRRLVLRSDAPAQLPGSIDRDTEYAVVEAARAAGVLTPAPFGRARDLVRAGASSYFLEWAPGVALGRQVVSSPELAAARGSLADSLAGELAKLHSLRPTDRPDLMPRRLGWQDPSSGPSPVENTLAALRVTLDGLPEPHPALEWAFDWLVRHPPPPSEVVLVHGDFRTGNFMVSPEGLSAILDWEFAHWGYPEEDLAWISVRDWRFGALDKPIGGFAGRAGFYAAYERASGRRVDRSAVHFWEIWGNVHWATGCVLQGERYRSGQSTDLELLAVARRAAEMEFEALRLIERGPR